MGKAPEYIMINGMRAGRDFYAEQVSVPPTKGWPMEPCLASGVNADQAGELRDLFRKHGETVSVDSEGNPVYENTSQRSRCLRLRGIHDRN